MSRDLLGAMHALVGAVHDHLEQLTDRQRRHPRAVTLAEVADHLVLVLAREDDSDDE